MLTHKVHLTQKEICALNIEKLHILLRKRECFYHETAAVTFRLLCQWKNAYFGRQSIMRQTEVIMTLSNDSAP